MPTLKEQLDTLIGNITAETTVVGGVVALLNTDTGIIATLKQQVADALAGINVDAEVQGKLDTAFADAQANTQALSDALVANTPAAPAA